MSENMAEIWRQLWIDEQQQYTPTTQIGQWQYVLDQNNNPVRADEVMRAHGFNPDRMAIDAINGVLATDSLNPMPNLGQINGLALDSQFLGFGELSLLQQNCIIQNLCSISAHYMTEKWVTFHSTDEAKKDKIIQLEKAISKYNIKELTTKLIYNAYLFGTSYVSPKILGDETDLKNPLILSNAKIKKNSLEAFYVIEPTWVVPLQFNMSKPRSPNFYKPEQYVVYGETLHHSRLQRFMFIDAVNVLSPMYLFGGIPPSQLILPYVLNFLNTNKQIVQIISRYNLDIVSTNLNAIGNVDAIRGRLTAFTQMRNNWSTLLLDKETEALTQMQINVSGLTDILQQQGELLSLFTRIPVTYLFGQSPRGLNATGQLDAQVFNENILSMQESKLRPLLDYVFDVLQLNEFGEIDEDITYTFNPLGSIDELTQQQINTAKINDLCTLVNSGVADPTQIMEVLRQDEKLGLSSYEGVDYEDEDDFMD